MRVTSEGANFGGSPRKFLEYLDCPRLHFARFHSGESEEEKIQKQQQQQQQ